MRVGERREELLAGLLTVLVQRTADDLGHPDMIARSVTKIGPGDGDLSRSGDASDALRVEALAQAFSVDFGHWVHGGDRVRRAALDDEVGGRRMRSSPTPRTSALHTNGSSPPGSSRPHVRSRRRGLLATQPAQRRRPRGAERAGRHERPLPDGLPRHARVAAAMPVVRELLVAPGSDAGWVTALTDDAGRLLWVEGEPGVRRQIEGVGLRRGSRLARGLRGHQRPRAPRSPPTEPVQVVGYEHFARKVQPWNCAAVPVHAPTARCSGCSTSRAGPSSRPRS